MAILVLVLILGYPLGKSAYQNWGRKLIYPISSKITEYPGDGKITQVIGERLFIIPGNDQHPFFDTVEQRENYPGKDYKVFTIQAQDRLLYALGTFEGWEDIDGTLDKYILVKYPSQNEVEKWRIAFEHSDLFKDEITFLLIENVGIRWDKKINKIEKSNQPYFSGLGFGGAKNIFIKGDAVALMPVFDPPKLAKKDNNGNYLTSKVTIRRVGGKYEN